MLTRLFKKLSAAWRIHRDPVAYARSVGVQIGEGCRLLGMTPGVFGSEPFMIRMGNRVTVTAGVRFITHDGGVDVLREGDPDLDVVAPITIGDNVFIGTNALLMPGVTVGSNCIIGAGAVVTRDIPSGHVAAGVPARCLKTIDEYREKVRATAFRSRSSSPAEKRRMWEARYFPAKHLDINAAGHSKPAG
jgi:acetyltransferase-like isoleucine patch superfamily enzyme